MSRPFTYSIMVPPVTPSDLQILLILSIIFFYKQTGSVFLIFIKKIAISISHIIMITILYFCYFEVGHQVQFYNFKKLPSFTMIKGENILNTSRTQSISSGRAVTGLTVFSSLFKLISQYIKTYQSASQNSSPQGHDLSNKDKRLEGIQIINKLADRLKHDHNLQEEEKSDCLIQSLRIMKKMNKIITKNDIETRSKRLSFRKQQQAIQVSENSLIQKLAQLMLTSIFPQKRTIKTIRSYICIIIQQLYQYFPDEVIQEGEKTKRPNKKTNKQKISIQCYLQSGTKINVLWYLIFRIIQKNLEDLQSYWAVQIQQNEKKQVLLSDLIEKHVLRYIQQVINNIIMEQFRQLNLLKELVNAIVKNINQFQLPIVPFFLKEFHKLFQQKFKIYFRVGFENDQTQKNTYRNFFSFQNISILLQLIKIITHQIMPIKMQKIPYATYGFCSYCGLMRAHTNERLFFQKLVIQTHQSQNLIVTICQNCCKQLNTSPSDKANLIILAPIILSRYWKSQFGNQQINKVKQALVLLMRSHCQNQIVSKGNKVRKDGKKISKSTQIVNKIAMNNIQQAIPTNVLQQIYNTFLYFHSSLAIKDILFNIIYTLIIFCNSNDQKIRQKSIKIMIKFSLTSFLYGNLQHLQTQYIDQVSKIRNKLTQCLESRIRDSNMSVSLSSLQFLTEIYQNGKLSLHQRQCFFDQILKQISFRDSSEYKVKSISIISKMIERIKLSKTSKQQKQILSYFRFFVKTLIFCTYILSSLECQINSNTVKQSFQKLLCILVDRVVLVSRQKYTEQIERDLQNQLKQFVKSKDNGKFHLASLQDLNQKILLRLLSSVKIDAYILKNLPQITSQHISQLFEIADQCERESTARLIIQKNIIFIINTAYQQIIGMKEHIYQIKKRQSFSQQFSTISNYPLLDYIHSSTFIQLLINPTKSQTFNNLNPNSCVPDIYKLQILNRLLYLNNINQVISNQNQMSNYMSIWLKSKRRSANNTIYRIIMSQTLQKRLQDLSHELLQNIKAADISDLKIKISSIVNIKMYLGKVDQIKGIISIYQKYSIKFFNSFQHQYNQYKQSTNNEIIIVNKLISVYYSLVRCCHISTFLIVQLQNYLIFNQKICHFYESKISHMIKDKKQRAPISVYSRSNNDQVVLTSSPFKNLYALILNVLNESSQIISQNQYLCEYFKKMFLLLKIYWQTCPKIIFTEPILIKILQKINQNQQQSFIIIKYMYKLFQSLLPSHNLQLLIFIRDQFTKKFHFIIKCPSPKFDVQFAQTSFNIIYHLLKSGMDGLYTYNKYIFYGLFYDSPKVNKIVLRLIRQMYSEQVSQKILFINIAESIQFIFETYFNFKNATPFGQIQFTDNQKHNLSLFSQIRGTIANPCLPKEKRQIKLRSSLIKKVGDYIGNEFNLVKSKPRNFTILMKLLKCQKTADYTELVQIIYCLNKLTHANQGYIQRLIQQLMHYPQIQYQSRDFLIKSQIILAYRQMVSCLAYFTKYKESQHQIKNYNAIFDSCSNPYIQLQQLFPLTNLKIQEEYTSKINKIKQDINLFIDFIIGGVQYVPPKILKYQAVANEPANSRPAKTKIKLPSKLIENQGGETKDRAYYSRSVQHSISGSNSHENQDIADTYKTRLRKQTRRLMMQ